MIKRLAVALLLLVSASVLPFTASAAQPKSYEVTGTVTELTDDTITVLKGKESFNIARDAATKVTGELKVGAKVHIDYRMSAGKIDVKDAAAAKKK